MDQPLHESLTSIQSGLASAKQDPSLYAQVASELLSVAEATDAASMYQLAGFSRLLANVVGLIENCINDAPDDAVELALFVETSLSSLSAGLNDLPEASEEIDTLTNEAQTRWGECLKLVSDENDEFGASWSATEMEEVGGAPPSDEPAPDANALSLILGSLVAPALESTSDEAQSEEQSEKTPAEASSEKEGAPSIDASGENRSVATGGEVQTPDAEDANEMFGAASGASGQAVLDEVDLKEDLELDPELQEAYTDDAQRCLASIESSLLSYEDEPKNRQPLQQVCRELHTLKGASASVGLEKLASFLHNVEDNLQSAVDESGAQPVDLQPIFRAVDAVREQVSREQPQVPNAAETAPRNAMGVERIVDAGPATQDSVRVKAAQLDRLMDMLAELVMLRNRRESRVENLKSIHNEMIRCVTRMRSNEQRHASANGPNRYRSSSQAEIANDLLAIGSNLRELYEPVGDENMAISRFIRQFRQELIQLRRVPVGGLFQRLQRSARDAARSEGKKVRIELVGEEVGLETAIQQQLYEPLLHIVRNAVSHGIEPEEKRINAGKSPAGNVTLEAHGGSNLLVITVRDDGKGLDYDALRRRGHEMGLIPADRPVSRPDLARLIFHPGFSTKSSASEVSGRGVGMDVVLAALERMHSWVEVDSVPGQGSSVRLLIPLQSVIEHVMVFRVAGQEFGVATHNVTFAGDANSEEFADLSKVQLSGIFKELEQSSSDEQQMIVLANSAGTKSGNGAEDREEECLGLLVDEIIGPEEVVVRPLPNLMASQGLFSGVTLSGIGDIMLLFDSKQLMNRGLTSLGKEPVEIPQVRMSKRLTKRVLVVDDSRTSRRTLIQSLAGQPFDIDEACDGVEALRRIKETDYDLIFTDLEMPEMTGLDLLRQVRAGLRTQDIPVIMVSSRDEPEFKQQAADSGITDYLIKPVSEPIVSAALERLHEQKLEEVEV